MRVRFRLGVTADRNLTHYPTLQLMFVGQGSVMYDPGLMVNAG